MNIRYLIILLVVAVVTVRAIVDGYILEHILFFLVGVGIARVCILLYTWWKLRKE